MAIKTQGTRLYVVDPSDDSVVEIGCVTSFNGLTQPKDQVDVTCLSDLVRRFMAGLGTPGAATFGINFDTADESHLLLETLNQSGDTVNWALGLSDGTAAPTGADSAGEFILPTTRSWVTFDAYVADLPLNLAQNSVVQSEVSLQVSGSRTIVPKA